MSLLPLLVVEAESAVQLEVVVGITKTAVGIAVPEQTIILIGHHKWYGHFRVVLEQILIFPLHVQLLRLMLSQSIERLVSRAVKEQSPA